MIYLLALISQLSFASSNALEALDQDFVVDDTARLVYQALDVPAVKIPRNQLNCPACRGKKKSVAGLTCTAVSSGKNVTKYSCVYSQSKLDAEALFYKLNVSMDRQESCPDDPGVICDSGPTSTKTVGNFSCSYRADFGSHISAHCGYRAPEGEPQTNDIVKF